MSKLRLFFFFLLVLLALSTLVGQSSAETQISATSTDTESWRQWGGSRQDFKASSKGLADAWPEGGPVELWKRELGDGYSAILFEDGRLYTMYRSGDNEVVIAMDAATGEAIWETPYDHSPWENHVSQFGDGPRATPLLSGDSLYTVGVAGRMHSLDKKNGEIRWSRDLWGEELAGNRIPHGYSSSPIEHGDKVIVLVGDEDASVVALDKADGSIAWKSSGYKNSYSTPQILNVGGQEQLVTFMATELIALDPETGESLWSHPQKNQWRQNINLPVLVDGRYLFLSSIEAGSKGLELTREGGKTKVEELWSTRKIQFYHVTTVRQGDWVYGTTGSTPAFMAAINVKTGEIGWRKRGFAKANTIYADDKLYILDEDGKLSMATATPEDLTVHAEAQILDKVAWTAPTIVGATMYVRDKSQLMALDLGRGESTVAKSKLVADPLEVLKQADAAAKAVSSVRFESRVEPHGLATSFMSAAEGEGVYHGWDGQRPKKFHVRARVQARGAAGSQEVEGGGDGEMFFLLDHGSRKAYEDFDPGVLGSSGGLLMGLGIIELVHESPFEDELSSDAELLGLKEVEGEECYEIHVVYSGDRGASTWCFSTEDYLPRQRVRHFSQGDAEGKVVITLAQLEIDPKLDAAMFELELPQGYEQIDDFAP